MSLNFELNESIVIDFSKLDEIDLDTLPSTQVEKALKVLEEIKGRLETRVALHEGELVRTGAHVVDLGNSGATTHGQESAATHGQESAAGGLGNAHDVPGVGAPGAGVIGAAAKPPGARVADLGSSGAAIGHPMR
ncbi:hypothetical protein RIF29_16131 [Crotalaria pallida]|uniref:Uncharacterized protein n=1 Tax=Crotalaria pallida TaxID=3830 RepID=A0AAN9FKE5_CROPI